MGAALESEMGQVLSAGDLGQPTGVGAWQWSGKGSVQRWERGPILGLPILSLPLLPMAHPKVIGQVTMLFSINREWRWGGGERRNNLSS